MLNPLSNPPTDIFTLPLWQSQNDVAKCQRRFQQVLNLCYVKLPNFSIIGLTDFFWVLRRFCNRLMSFDLVRNCASTADNYLEAKIGFSLYLYWSTITITQPLQRFSLFSNKHCLFHIFYDHASNTCHMCTPYVHASYHMPYCKVPLCELQLVMLKYCYKDAYYSTLWTVPILTVIYVS